MVSINDKQDIFKKDLNKCINLMDKVHIYDNLLIKHIDIDPKYCLICNSEKNKSLFGFVHKYNEDTNNFFYYLNDKYHIYNKKQYSDCIEEKIKFIMDHTNLSRNNAIEQLKKNDIALILINNSLY